jgi:hypothetical protein
VDARVCRDRFQPHGPICLTSAIKHTSICPLVALTSAFLPLDHCPNCKLHPDLRVVPLFTKPDLCVVPLFYNPNLKMKAVVAAAFAAGVAAQGWEAVPDPAKTSTTTTWADWTSSTTTTKPVDPETTYSYWGDVTTKPVDPKTTSTTTWADWTSTSTKSKPVDDKSTSSTHWADWKSTSTKPVDDKTTSTTTWADWKSTTTKPVSPDTTTYWGDASKPVDPASTWVDADVCTVKVVTVTAER